MHTSWKLKAIAQRQNGRQEKAQRQARKGTNAGKERLKGRRWKMKDERHKGRQGKAQRQRQKTGKERHKSRQGKPKFKIKIINPINHLYIYIYERIRFKM
jgi:hypothetical protein